MTANATQQDPGPLPLEGVTVVDMSQVIVGPAASQVLADNGANVIKVESKSGDLMRNMSGRSISPGMGSKFLHLNANKRSLAIDFKHPDGHAALLELIRKADVLLWNFRPSAMARLHLSYEEVRELNPAIVYCGILGFGLNGRYAGKRAYDASIQGAAGLAALSHRAAGEPRYVPMAMADRVCGMVATQMIAMALYRRARTGKGCSVTVPMFENIAKLVLEDQMYLQTYEPPLGGVGDPRALHPLCNPSPTKDGWLCISPNTDQQAFAFFDLIGQPELKTDPRFSTVPARYANIDEFFRIRQASLTQKTSAEWMEAFDRAGVPVMPYNSLEQLLEDPHLKDSNFFEVRSHPTEGNLRTIRSPNEWSCGSRDSWMPPPKLGQHSVEVLREAGYAEAVIERMISSGVILDGRLKEA